MMRSSAGTSDSMKQINRRTWELVSFPHRSKNKSSSKEIAVPLSKQ